MPDPLQFHKTWAKLSCVKTLVTPFSDAIWRAIARETDLAVQLICSGANDISRADYTNHGRYATAQCGFTNGIKRLGKLVFKSDSILAISEPMSDSDLRKKGHAVSSLLNEVEGNQALQV